MATFIVGALLAAFLWRLARAFVRDVRSGCCCSCCSGGCSGCCSGCSGGSCASCGGCAERR